MKDVIAKIENKKRWFFFNAL